MTIDESYSFAYPFKRVRWGSGSQRDVCSYFNVGCIIRRYPRQFHRCLSIHFLVHKQKATGRGDVHFVGVMETRKEAKGAVSPEGKVDMFPVPLLKEVATFLRASTSVSLC